MDAPATEFINPHGTGIHYGYPAPTIRSKPESETDYDAAKKRLLHGTQ
jgi:hypothetical protein